jgi:hypothetical protein
MNLWNRFWFSTADCYSLGLFRFALCIWVGWSYLSFLPSMRAMARRPEEFFFPSAALRWLGLGWIGDQIPELTLGAAFLVVAGGLGIATAPLS